MSSRVTLCALLYGDYPVLARRCLAPIRQLSVAAGLEVRIGMNAVSDATRDVVADVFRGYGPTPIVIDSRDNILKYPMMRRLLYEEAGGVTTPLVMWFDDDAYLEMPTEGWLQGMFARMPGVPSAVLLGSVYRQSWLGQQREWVRAQPWYQGKDPTLRPKIQFAQGSWWLADMGFLRHIGYPWAELRHRGGDTMLGEAVFQAGYRLVHDHTAVAVNADAFGRHSKSKRRGVDEPSLGVNFSGAGVAPSGTAVPVILATRPTQIKGRGLPRF